MFLNFEQKKTLINSYLYSNLNYCPLVWLFSSAKALNSKVEFLQKRALRFLYEDYVSSYEELLQKAGKETTKVNRLRSPPLPAGTATLWQHCHNVVVDVATTLWHGRK